MGAGKTGWAIGDSGDSAGLWEKDGASVDMDGLRGGGTGSLGRRGRLSRRTDKWRHATGKNRDRGDARGSKFSVWAADLQNPYVVGPHGRFVEWTPQGSHIVFDDGSRVMMVDLEGTRLDTVVDANPGHWYNDDANPPLWFDYGFHADLSPDGTRIVYSSCEYPTGDIDTSAADWRSERRKYNYEIASVALDGSAPSALPKTAPSTTIPCGRLI